MPVRKTSKAAEPTAIQKQQMKVAEKAAKKARRAQAEESREDLQIKLTELIKKQLPEIEKDLKSMTPKERCDTIAKLAPYVLPKLVGAAPVADADEGEVDELTELAQRTTGQVAN